MRQFIGRNAELASLRNRLTRVGRTADGVALTIRGRRQVGKSRLVQEFCDRSGVPYFFFSATKGASPVEAAGRFTSELRESSLPTHPELTPDVTNGSWLDAFRVLAAGLPDTPSVVVLDELPWLAEQDPVFDGALQTAWDRSLRSRPVLLLLLGSDLHMMERLTAYDRPFFGRADSLILGPLNPAETADALELCGSDALDAHLVCGGLPGILAAWEPGTTALDFIRQECEDAASPLFGVPESTLLSEFPIPMQASRVLEAVGSGERTQTNIAVAAGGPSGPMPSGSLSPVLRQLVEDKRVLAVDYPVSTRPGKPALYRVADSNLRLYLAILRAVQEQSRRGRPEIGYRLVQRRWSTWRGRAVEPLVRTALELALMGGGLPWSDVEVVGGWWNRRFDPEVDLVGADRAPVARAVRFVGSVKWLNTPFDRRDLAALTAAAPQVPGWTPGESGLVVVSRSEVAVAADVDVVWRPEDVVAAYRSTR